MKFVIALLGLVAAQEKKPLLQDALCKQGEADPCDKGLCCGTATEDVEDPEREEPAKKKNICNDKTSNEWVDENDDEILWTFKCIPLVMLRLTLQSFVTVYLPRCV